MALTKEERDELATLEQEDTDRRKEEEDAAKRQHLDALRMSKRLSAKYGKPGHDFVVCETTLGVNIAIRRPQDVEVDEIDEASEREDLEKLAQSVAIEPAGPEVARLMSEHHGLVGGIVGSAMKLLKSLRAEEAKK